MINFKWIYDAYDSCWLWRSEPGHVTMYELKIKIRESEPGAFYFNSFYHGRYLTKGTKKYSTLKDATDAAEIHIVRLLKVLEEI